MIPISPQQQLFATFAMVGRALGNPHRLELLEQLAQGECAVEKLAAQSQLSVANTSQHLQQLRRAGLVNCRRQGKNMLYRLADGPVIAAIDGLRKVAEHNLAEIKEVVRSCFSNLDSMEPVSRGELIGWLADGSVTVLDVRPEDEYRSGHLPGALNICVEELATRLSFLPSDREIIAYCRGPYCILTFEAIRVLREHGYQVRRLEDGFPEWEAAGLPVERLPRVAP